ncbi:DNA polymerase epsilon [Cyclospora cayetanensis]|uniref:DNA polymerase epsilon n=1 Tax=Cyclospora cayetanensis TaxID=88456 RepID=A0A1D3D8L7_9EIME|nr:DNA polymerase epsilon [Cyclospora cayetanensis]
MTGEDILVDSYEPPELFADEDEEEGNSMQQEGGELQQRLPQQRRHPPSESTATSSQPFSYISNNSVSAATGEPSDSLPFAEAAARPSELPQEQPEEMQHEAEETVNRSAVLMQCGGCPCHLLVFEELEARNLLPSFDLLHLIPMKYTWGLEEPQEVKMNLSMLRFAFDCMQSIMEAGVGCSGQVAFLSSFLAFCRLRRQRKMQTAGSGQVFVLDAFRDIPEYQFDEPRQVTCSTQRQRSLCGGFWGGRGEKAEGDKEAPAAATDRAPCKALCR